jgi:hypothetical protein
LRNFIVLYALENGLEVPLGTQDAELLDERFNDEDAPVLWTDENDAEDESLPDDDMADVANDFLNELNENSKKRGIDNGGYGTDQR